MFEHRIVF